MTSKRFKAFMLLCLAIFTFASLATAQEADLGPATPDLQVGPQVAIDVPSDGVLYNERGELVVSAALTNSGSQSIPPLDVVVVLLNDCILTSVPQTCRFAAFGSFQDVAPDGIAPANSLAWAFNFGPYPRLELDRWTVIWYPRYAASIEQPAGGE